MNPKITADNVRDELEKFGISYDDVLEAVFNTRLDVYIKDLKQMSELAQKEIIKESPNYEALTNILQYIYKKAIATEDLLNEGPLLL